jgi:hypothetical protein
MPDPTTELVPIGLLAAEGFDPSTVAHRCADQLETNAAGLHCLSASTVRALITERDQRQQADRERRVAEDAERKARDPIPGLRRRLQALKAAQPAPVDGNVGALAQLVRPEADAHDGQPLDEKLRPAGAPLTYHSISPERT